MPVRRNTRPPDTTYLGEFEQLILFAVLGLEQASGIAIHDEIEARTGRDVSPGAIYTTLGRLEDRGLVTSEILAPDAGRVGRPRKHYTLQPAGARALRTAYSSLQALAGGSLAKLGQDREQGMTPEHRSAEPTGLLRWLAGVLARGPDARFIRHDLDDLYARDRTRGIPLWRAQGR